MSPEGWVAALEEPPSRCIARGKGGATSPQVLAHEFGHAYWWPRSRWTDEGFIINMFENRVLPELGQPFRVGE